MSAPKTRDKLTPDGERLMKMFKGLKQKPAVKVGVLGAAFELPKESKKADGTETVDQNVHLGDVAVANEFGTDHIPERSFIRSTVDEKRLEWARYAEKLKKKMLTGELTTNKALGIMGLLIQRDIQRKIRSNIQPANAPSTIAAKGSSKTLINSAQLLNSIAWELLHAEKE